MTKKEFSKGWKHFCGCIDFGQSHLDAEAIQFMNEVPGKVYMALASAPELLEALEKLSKCAKRINDIQHGGDKVSSLAWSDLYDFTNHAQAVIAKAKGGK